MFFAGALTWSGRGDHVNTVLLQSCWLRHMVMLPLLAVLAMGECEAVVEHSVGTTLILKDIQDIS